MVVFFLQCCQMGEKFTGVHSEHSKGRCFRGSTFWESHLHGQVDLVGKPCWGVTAVLLITGNCQYFLGFILLFSFVFQLYDKNGVTMSGVLKRKYEELGDDSTYCSSSSCSPLSSSASSGWDTDEENSRGEPKPSSALTSSFTREYLWLSQDQPCLCMGFFIGWWWVMTTQRPPWSTPLRGEVAVMPATCHDNNL